MRRRAVLVAAVVLALASATSNAKAWDGDDDTGTSSAHSAAGYVLTVRALGKIGAVVGGGGGSAGGGGVRWWYGFAPACAGNAGRDGDVLCRRAVAACRRVDRSALLYYVFRGLDPAALRNVATVCLGAGDFVERARLDRDVAAVARRLPLAPPEVRTAPPTVTLTGLPTVFWAANPTTGAPDPPRHTVTATVDDVRVTLTVTGAWTWRLDDGHPPRTLPTAGTAYRPGVTPDPRTDPDYYTHHTHRSGGPVTGLVTAYPRRGTATVRLTVTWTPSYTVDHQLGTRRLDTATVTYTTTRTLRIGEARAVLVADPHG